MKRNREESTGGRWSPNASENKRRKRYQKSSPTRFSSPREQRIVPGGRSRSTTGDLDVILQQFVELRFRIENIEEKLSVIQYQLKNIERFFDNRKPLEQEKSSQSCLIM